METAPSECFLITRNEICYAIKYLQVRKQRERGTCDILQATGQLISPRKYPLEHLQLKEPDQIALFRQL